MDPTNTTPSGDAIARHVRSGPANAWLMGPRGITVRLKGCEVPLRGGIPAMVHVPFYGRAAFWEVRRTGLVSGGRSGEAYSITPEQLEWVTSPYVTGLVEAFVAVWTRRLARRENHQ